MKKTIILSTIFIAPILLMAFKTHRTNEVLEWKQYSNEKYGFNIYYPAKWQVDKEAPLLTTYNYELPEATRGETFKGSQTKIEITTVHGQSWLTDSSYDLHKEPEICKLSCYKLVSRVTSTTNKHDRTVSFTFKLPNDRDSYLFVTLFGDNSNLWILEEMVESIEFK